MDAFKKRRLEEGEPNARTLPNLNEEASFFMSYEELHALVDPLTKPMLVDLLCRAASQYPSIAEEIKSVASADPALRKLFVRGLAWNTTTETLCAAFEEHGEIEEGAVIYDKVTGNSRGYGFITFKDMESAQSALKAPSKMIDGRLAVCNLASEGLSSTSTATDQSQRKLYVGGLSPDTTSEMLLSFFSRHGEIEEGSVAYDKDSNRPRGFGFVTYKTVESAKRALDDPQRFLGGRNVTVKLADNYKGKAFQQQMPGSGMSMARHMGGGYQHPSSSHIGYGYNPYMAAYQNASYASPQAAAAASYSSQAQQYSYPTYGGRKDATPEGGGYGGYPYYGSY